MERRRVIVIGSLNYDLFLNVQKLPQLGETYQASSFQTASGGKGANQAVQCAKLGIDTFMVGAVGKDFMGEYLLESISQYGVHTEYVQQVEGPSGLGVVHLLKNGGVLSTIVPGANACVGISDVQRVESLMDEAFAVVLQLEIPIETVQYAIHAANRHSAKIYLNAAPAHAIEKDCVSLCDTFIANEIEASYYTKCKISSVEDALKVIAPFACDYKVRSVFTLGEQGVVAFDGHKAYHEPAVKTIALDTTGAGDSFVGGYLKAQITGMSFIDSIRFATQCSAITVSQVGGQNAMPALDRVKGFYLPV